MIEINHVSKTFGEEKVLKDVSHFFAKGQTHGIVGNNGSGKTVLMKCICGFLLPDSGEVKVDGKRIGKDVDFPDSIGVIIETPGFLPHMSGRKNLQILASLKQKIDREDIDSYIKMVGLDPKIKKPVGKYSLGMRQRLGIAQAIMENPEVLILDEPFNGLDKNGVLHIRNLLKSLHDEGKTILLASHNSQDIEELCQTVCEMDAGILTIKRTRRDVEDFNDQEKAGNGDGFNDQESTGKRRRL